MKYRDAAPGPPPQQVVPRATQVRWSRLWPGAVVVGITGWVTAAADVRPESALLYLLAFVWSVLLPGMLVHRALRGRPRFLVADLALGGATGLVLQLVAWALLTAAGAQAWLAAWPVVVLVPFALIRRLRGCWHLGRYPRVVEPVAALLAVVAYLLPLSAVVQSFTAANLPPAPTNWYQDDLWHLALSAELMRSIPPDIPQLAGRTFFYHWFSNAHIAAMSWTTGIDLPVVFARLWVAPVLAVSVGLMLAVGERLTSRIWPGSIGALLMAAGAALLPSWFSLPGFTAFHVHSPSQQFSVPIILLILYALIEALRGVHLGVGGWAFLGLALLGASGAKSSVLPVVVCGLLLGLAVAVLVNRRLVRRLAGLLGLALAVLLSTSILTAGGSAGVTLQLFSTVRATAPWVVMAGRNSSLSTGSVIPGIGQTGAVALLGLILALWVVSYAWLLPGGRALQRRDLTGWVLLGVGLGGFGAMMVLNQDGLSQVYFMSGALVAWYVVAAWGLALLWDSARMSAGRRHAIATAALGAGLGILLVELSQLLSGPKPQPTELNASLLRAFVVPVVVATAALTTLWLARRLRRPAVGASTRFGVAVGAVAASFVRLTDPPSALALGGRATPLVWLLAGLLVLAGLIGLLTAVRIRLGRIPLAASLTVTTCVILGLVAAALTVRMAGQLDLRVADGPPAPASVVSSDEARAALWLKRSSDREDILATNVHCRQKKTVPYCDARAFWVTAFTERRALVESWAYTTAAHEAHGVGGRPYSRQPFDDPALFALNERAFVDPSAEVLSALKARGVDWLFADAAAGPVSPELRRLAELTLESGTVTIYRLR